MESRLCSIYGQFYTAGCIAESGSGQGNVTARVQFPCVIVSASHFELVVSVVYAVADAMGRLEIERCSVNRNQPSGDVFCRGVFSDTVSVNPHFLIDDAVPRLAAQIEEGVVAGVQHGGFVRSGLIVKSQGILVGERHGECH